MVEIRRVTPDDIGQASRALALAFRDDPALSWAAPNARRRERFLPGYLEKLIRRTYLPKGEVYMTDDGGAAAVWAPPDNWQTSFVASLPSMPIMVRTCGTRLPRAMKMLTELETLHKLRAELHFHLQYIGTAPDAQGKGLGTVLLTHMLDRCDAEGIPAYLEASSIKNQALYHRHGFEVEGERHRPKGGPPWWPMWRKPR